MSHREHILAFLAPDLATIRAEHDNTLPAFNPLGFTPRSDYLDNILYNKFHHATEITWRDTAEYWPEAVLPKDFVPRHRQILPYALLTKTINGEKHYGVYQRVKGIGEERLLRGHSMGFGGHLGGKFVKYDDHSGIDVRPSIVAGLASEMLEECHVDTSANGVCINHHGYIHSFASPVDALHLSVVLEVNVPEDYPVLVNEKGLVFKGFYTRAGIMELHATLPKEIGFESWTKFLVEQFL
jgi:predicted NUDIX family phosphoesterase